MPPSNSFSVGQQQSYQNHDAGNHIFQSPPTHVAFTQSERKGISQEDQFTTGVNSQAQSAYKEMNPATRGEDICIDRLSCSVTEVYPNLLQFNFILRFCLSLD